MSSGAALSVGFLIDRWGEERGGAERALAAFAHHLQRQGAEVLVFAERAAGELSAGRLIRVPTSGVTRAARERRLAHALVRAARDARCDVTVGVRHLPEVDLYWPHGGVHAVSVAARDRSRGRPPRARLRGRHAVFASLERELLAEGGARRVVAVSELVQRELCAHYPACAARVRCIPNGVDLERFRITDRAERGARWRAAHGVRSDAPLIAFLGREPLLKGLPAALEALAGLRRRPWTLVIAGPPRAERWRARAARLGIEPTRVVALERTDAAELLAATDLVVLPTWRDTAYQVVLEGLASGVPVVTTKCAGAARGRIEEANGALLDDPGDAERLRVALERWLERLASEREPDRGALRACVLELDDGRWLAALEHELRA